jgi:hypothetical protein
VLHWEQPYDNKTRRRRGDSNRFTYRNTLAKLFDSVLKTMRHLIGGEHPNSHVMVYWLLQARFSSWNHALIERNKIGLNPYTYGSMVTNAKLKWFLQAYHLPSILHHKYILFLTWTNGLNIHMQFWDAGASKIEWDIGSSYIHRSVLTQVIDSSILGRSKRISRLKIWWAKWKKAPCTMYLHILASPIFSLASPFLTGPLVPKP